ncbi:MAG: hypothetical protein LBQ66_16235 [Planctomycetaceae bacterium]|nr:hypothetical protein [Planctomycetaceae bacterium]
MPMRFGDPAVGEYADVTARRSVTHLTLPPGGRLPTLRSSIRVGVQFQLVRFHRAQRRAGRLVIPHKS